MNLKIRKEEISKMAAGFIFKFQFAFFKLNFIA